MENKAILKIKAKDTRLFEKSLYPDTSASNSKGKKVKIKCKNGYLIVKIECKKLSHLKGIINSYLTLINMLKGVDKLDR